MPLYMDIHKVETEDFTVGDVIKAHMEDLRVERQFGVKQKMYWVNEKDNTVFCLMEGPDEEACKKVHEVSHGGTACNIIQVSVDEYNLFMARDTTHKNDLAYHKNGTLDAGYRTIVLVDVCNFSGVVHPYTHDVNRLVDEFNGSVVPMAKGGAMASFSVATNALLCAVAIAKKLDSISKHLEFRVAVASGNPVDVIGSDIFQETRKKLQVLCELGLDRFIYIDAYTKALSQGQPTLDNLPYNRLKVVSSGDYQFFHELSNVLQNVLTESHFSSTNLAAQLGLSKAQAYRKIKYLTGLSSNELIREYRLRKSLRKLRENTISIAEVAYSTGFNSPTYFTRVFKGRYGTLPTEYMRVNTT